MRLPRDVSGGQLGRALACLGVPGLQTGATKRFAHALHHAAGRHAPHHHSRPPPSEDRNFAWHSQRRGRASWHECGGVVAATGVVEERVEGVRSAHRALRAAYHNFLLWRRESLDSRNLSFWELRRASFVFLSELRARTCRQAGARVTRSQGWLRYQTPILIPTPAIDSRLLPCRFAPGDVSPPGPADSTSCRAGRKSASTRDVPGAAVPATPRRHSRP